MMSNNWYGIRNRNGREGFRFIVWDAEHTLLKDDLEIDRTGPFPAGNDFASSNPQFIWQQCLENAEFRMKVADHIQRHFFNGGILTPERLTTMFDFRILQIENAVVCESARWGDSEAPNIAGGDTKEGLPLNRDDHWMKVVNETRNEYLLKRSYIVLAQLFSQGLYPDLKVPSAVITDDGSDVVLTFNAALGEVLFTTNGTDPRLIGGQRSASATVYNTPVELAEDVQFINARVYEQGEWSALIQLER